jgi:mycofactocin precursor
MKSKECEKQELIKEKEDQNQPKEIQGVLEEVVIEELAVDGICGIY